jgi:hypothetical protein
MFRKAGGLSAQLFDHARNQAILLGSERVKEVLDLNCLVTLLGGNGLGRCDSFLSIFCKLVQVHL